MIDGPPKNENGLRDNMTCIFLQEREDFFVCAFVAFCCFFLLLLGRLFDTVIELSLLRPPRLTKAFHPPTNPDNRSCYYSQVIVVVDLLD